MEEFVGYVGLTSLHETSRFEEVTNGACRRVI